MKNSQRIHSNILETLKLRIQQGEWLPGVRMPTIMQFSQELGVGSGTVREVLRSLESLGVVTIKHGSGVYVSSEMKQDPSLQFSSMGKGIILALCETRRIIEPELAFLAAQRGNADEQAELTHLAEKMAEQARKGEDFLSPDLQFHRQIAYMSHNPVMARMMDSIADLLVESRKYTIRPTMTMRAVRYHLMIAEAIAEHNCEQARLLMLAHVNDATNVLLKTDSG
jgi:DNA-binding FadR family transcriptional regulator